MTEIGKFPVEIDLTLGNVGRLSNDEISDLIETVVDDLDRHEVEPSVGTQRVGDDLRLSVRVTVGAPVVETYGLAYVMGMATRIVPKTHLRDRIRSEMEDLGDDTLVVTERGRPVAVLVSVDRWNDLQESLEDLEDHVAILEHRLSGGMGKPAEQVFSAIEAEEADVRSPARKAG